MKAAIIIPSFNGANKLSILLKSIASQWRENYEIIIVDDGSDKPIELDLSKDLAQLVTFRIIRTKNKGRASARNSGVNETTAEVIIFCDDDMELPVGVLERHVKFHEENLNAILIGNPVPFMSMTSGDSFFEFRFEREMNWACYLENKGMYRCNFRDYFFTTQNMSIPKKLFEKLNGFDERLMDSEDFDLGTRALLKQVPIFVDGNLLVFHHDDAGLMATVRRQRQYYEWKIELLKLHPEYETLLPQHFAWLKNGFLKKLKKVIFKNTWWPAFFESKIFQYCPSKLKFYLFSSYIYSNSVL